MLFWMPFYTCQVDEQLPLPVVVWLVGVYVWAAVHSASVVYNRIRSRRRLHAVLRAIEAWDAYCAELGTQE